MLRVKSLQVCVWRLNTETAKGLKFGGFRDPWWANSRFGKPDQFAIPGKEKDKFPFIDDKGGPFRPMENMAWEKKFKKNTKSLRPYYQWDHYFSGHAPRPHWSMNQVSKTGTRKYMGGMCAKPLWCPPKKRQREEMVRTNVIDHEIPMEFMETYTRLNKRYVEELKAVRDFSFHQYVEPVLIEEEAIAQIQHWMAVNRWIHKKDDPLQFLKSIDIEPRKYPVRHRRFTNWYSFMKSDVDGSGRGQVLVQKQIKHVQAAVQNLSELQGNAGKPVEIRDLSRRLQWNEFRNEKMAPQFVKKLQRKQIEIMEEEEEEIKAVLKVEEKRQAQQKKHFDEWTEESKNFIYPTNMEDKLMEALSSPVTVNQPIDKQGVPTHHEAKVFTTERDYRLTPTEEEYFVIRKMKEEQRLKGNVDLEQHLSKVDESFDTSDFTSDAVDEADDLIKPPSDSTSDSIEDLLDLD